MIDGNPNAAVLSAATLVSLGLIQWFAIYFTGAGWSGLDDAAIYGAVGVVTQAVGFMILDLLIPGKLATHAFDEKLHPAAWVTAGLQLSVALIVCASLT